MLRRRSALVSVVASAVSSIVASAAAQQPPARPQDQPVARVLFDDARALMQRGDYGQACPKLEAASKLYAGSGVLLNLGDCYEHVGRTASAFVAFGDAAVAASRLELRDDEAEARRRQAALEPKLSRLVVRVAKEVPGLVVEDDGRPIDHPAWGIALPVDPGTHHISAEAPGRTRWSTSVDVGTTNATVTIEVPELKVEQQANADAAMTPTTPAVAPSSPEVKAASGSYWTVRRSFGAASTAVGAVAMGVGAVLALEAKSTYDTATGETGTVRHDDSASAVNRANVATVVVGTGAVLAVVGVVLWLTGPAASVSGRAEFLRATF